MNKPDLDKLRLPKHNTAPVAQTGLRRRWPVPPWVVLLGIVGLALALGLLRSKPEVELSTVVSVWPSDEFKAFDASGYVIARQRAAVASKGTGRLEWLGYSEGQFVKAGTVVARLESMDVAAAFRAAKANVEVNRAALANAQTELNDAQTFLKRNQTLYDKGLVAEMTLDEAKSRLARARSQVKSAESALAAAQANQDNAQSALDYTEIKAPFDGVVISRSANVGDIVTPLSSAADAKGAVMVMADMSSLQVSVEVSESSLAQVKVGQACEITLDAFPDKRLRGEVEAIVPTINRASATATTKIRIVDTDPAILPDMSARVSFLTQPSPPQFAQRIQAISPKALVQRDKQSMVWLVDAQQKLRAVPVQTGAKLGDWIRIQGELKPGDRLAIPQAKSWSDGQEIVIKGGNS